jgi:hypothetical protein
MVRNTRHHGWRDPQGLVNPSEIVLHEMKDNRRFVLRGFPASLKKHSRSG